MAPRRPSRAAKGLGLRTKFCREMLNTVDDEQRARRDALSLARSLLGSSIYRGRGRSIV